MTTHGNWELETGNSVETPVDAPAEREQAPESLETAKSILTLGNLRARAMTYFRPLAPLRQRPASLPELREYALTGTWTEGEKGLIRKAGVGYWRAVGRPVTVVCRYVELIAQRPGRSLLVFLVWRLVISNGPGPWVVKNVFTPVGTVLAWVFL